MKDRVERGADFAWCDFSPAGSLGIVLYDYMTRNSYQLFTDYGVSTDYYRLTFCVAPDGMREVAVCVSCAVVVVVSPRRRGPAVRVTGTRSKSSRNSQGGLVAVLKEPLTHDVLAVTMQVAPLGTSTAPLSCCSAARPALRCACRGRPGRQADRRTHHSRRQHRTALRAHGGAGPRVAGRSCARGAHCRPCTHFLGVRA